jgi:hypothetical protein
MIQQTATETFAPMPVWNPERPTYGPGFLTREQWAVEDSLKVNERIRQLGELREASDRLTATGRSGHMVISLDRMAARLEGTLERNRTHCTNSGMLRTECDTCDHTRQLTLMA